MQPFLLPPFAPERARQLRPAELEAAQTLTGLAHFNWVRAEPPRVPQHVAPLLAATLAQGRMRAHSQSLPEPRTPNPARLSAPPVLQSAHASPASSPSLEQRPRRLVESPSGQACPNCRTTESTLWRACTLLSGTHYLCNACGLRFKKGKFCPLCTRVYYDADTHTGAYKQCSSCGNWTHRACLQASGQLAKLEANAGDPFTRQPPYTCCRCAPTRERERKRDDAMDISLGHSV